MKAQEALRKIKDTISLENFATLMVDLRYDHQFWEDVVLISKEKRKVEHKKPDDYRT